MSTYSQDYELLQAIRDNTRAVREAARQGRSNDGCGLFIVVAVILWVAVSTLSALREVRDAVCGPQAAITAEQPVAPENLATER